MVNNSADAAKEVYDFLQKFYVYVLDSRLPICIILIENPSLSLFPWIAK
jgi:hypothetical protein